MSDDKKLTLTPRTTLGVGKSVETGQVKQSFSHGRSKAVVVERRKKRILNKGDAPAAGATSAAKPSAKPATGGAPAKGPQAPKGFTPKRTGGGSNLTNAETDARVRALEEAKKRAEAEKIAEEERRKAAAAEAVRRQQEEEAQRDAESAARLEMEKRRKAEAEEAEKKKAEEEAEKRMASQLAAKEKAEEEARKKAELAAKAVQLKKASEARNEGGQPSADDRKSAPKKAKDKRAEQQKQNRNTRGATGGDRRQAGRLTINRALTGDEEGRQRSLASFRRAQAKQRRAEMGGGNQQQPRQNREVTVPETITVQELANRMAEKSTEVIKTLMKLGVMATINQVLDQDTAELVVEELGHTMKRVSDADVEIGLGGAADNEADLKGRAPIVTVMGHVDHGKTSLLDALRKANVVSGEAGGITQHIGAYQVSLQKGGEKLTFLDTPGHAAFTEMRARGAKVTDIVVLVVAADDGVMPQTIEAINHAKAAEVPMIVAINKIDREGADPTRVRTELLQHEVVVESMSGDVQDVEISALKKTGLEELKEAIQLQAELLELKANPDRSAEGVVVEAKLDKGRGPVATVLVQRGTLKVGDIFVAGAQWGRVRALVNDHGQQVKEAGPSQPVEILGLQGTPGAGDEFAVVENEAKAREVSEYRQGVQRQKRQAAAAAPKTLEGIFSKMKESSETQSFSVVLKGDVQGSVEAITTALEKAGNDEIQCRVIHGAVGGITEADITLAQASEALVIGFNVRPNKQAREAAEQNGVVTKFYSIIYELIDDVKAAMAGQLGPEYNEIVIGNAEIKQVFTAGKLGMAAGCQVVEGKITRDAKARILRDDVIVFEGEINNLRRFKDDVREVQSGQECGLTFEGFSDFKPNDTVQVYTLEEVARTL